MKCFPKSAAAVMATATALTAITVGLTEIPASASDAAASSTYYGSCPGFPADAGKSTPVTVSPGPAEENWPVPDEVDIESTSPVDPSATGIHVDAPTLTLAAYQRAAHTVGTADVFCTAHGELKNALTVGAGTSGLSVGDPVTVVATIDIDGQLKFGEVDSHSFRTDADANAYFRVIDPTTGARAVDYTADGYLIVDGPSGAPVTQEYKHDLYLSSNATARVQETPAETFATVAQWPWPATVGSAPVDFGRDIGPRTVAFTTTVGATLDLDGSMQIDSDAQLGDATATADVEGVTASFAPDPVNPGITLTLATAPPVAVGPDTTTTVTTDRTTYVHGLPIPATARVTSLSGGIPSGSVTFAIDGQPWETRQLDSTGSASSDIGDVGWSYADFAVGTHEITASFVSDSLDGPSVGTTEVTVTKATVTTTLSAAPDPLVADQPFSMAVHLVNDVPTHEAVMGELDWNIDGRPSGSSTVTFNHAQVTIAGLHAGAHVITVCYAGNDSFAASCAAPVAVTVAKASTRTAVDLVMVPGRPRKPESLTATVSLVNPAVGTAGGTVTFRVDGYVLGEMFLVHGAAALPVDPKTLAGQHVVTVTYSGDVDRLPSSGQLSFPRS